MKKLALCLLCVALLAGCGKGPRIVPIDSLSPTRTPKPVVETPASTQTMEIPKPRVDDAGTTLVTRFNPAIGFSRQATEPGTFSAYLQSLPLLEPGAQVIAFDETVREQDDYAAVVSMEITGKNEQGAGVVAHLRAKFFYDKQEYTKVTFKLNDGFDFSFDKWRQGNKLKFNESKATWTTGGTVSDDEANFKEYLKTYFVYSGLASLKKDMSEVDVTDPVRIGDVLLTEGDKGRVFIVLDCATSEAGDRHVILAEGGKPAQPVRILKNQTDSELSPWIPVDVTNGLIVVDADVTLRLAPFDNGAVARYKFLTDASGA